MRTHINIYEKNLSKNTIWQRNILLCMLSLPTHSFLWLVVTMSCEILVPSAINLFFLFSFFFFLFSPFHCFRGLLGSMQYLYWKRNQFGEQMPLQELHTWTPRLVEIDCIDCFLDPLQIAPFSTFLHGIWTYIYFVLGYSSVDIYSFTTWEC